MPDGGADLQGVAGLHGVIAGDGDGFGDRPVETGRIELDWDFAGLSWLNLTVLWEGCGTTGVTRPDFGDFKHGVAGIGDDEIMPDDF